MAPRCGGQTSNPSVSSRKRSEREVEVVVDHMTMDLEAKRPSARRNRNARVLSDVFADPVLNYLNP